MPGETIDPNCYDYTKRFAKSLKSLRTVCQLSWTCPNCNARNRSDFDGDRLRRTYGTAIKARCGKCHNQKVTLLDPKGRTIRPDELLK
jgi:bacterioferritin-associated ferredoxin